VTTSEWERLAAAMHRCTACAELVAGRSTVVVGEAPAAPRLALVGEAPGAAEDATGRPFVGRAGQLLDRLLAEVGLHRDEVAVLNTVKCRPPGNRAPKPVELASCTPFLRAQLLLLRPSIVVALGLTAVRWFLGRSASLTAVRGVVHEVEVDGLRMGLIATYHPSAAIRFGPAGAPLAALREDLLAAAKATE
jgi:uracil-DNA glycosylase